MKNSKLIINLILTLIKENQTTKILATHNLNIIKMFDQCFRIDVEVNQLNLKISLFI